MYLAPLGSHAVPHLSAANQRQDLRPGVERRESVFVFLAAAMALAFAAGDNPLYANFQAERDADFSQFLSL